MKITTSYTLSEKEIAFLNTLAQKSHPKNEWSGMMEDDNFNKKWNTEITSFRAAGLAEKKDTGSQDTYWRYGLTEQGQKLQTLVLQGKLKFSLKNDF